MDTSPDETTNKEAGSTDSAEPIEPLVADTPADQPKKSRTSVVLGSLAIIVGLALVASQIYLITTLGSTRDDLGALEAQVADVEDAVTNVDVAVADLSGDIASVPQASAPTAQGVSPAPAVPEGYLPRFTNGAQDTALGLTLPTITGTEAYAQEVENIDPTDGTKRVWLIWAHWCPYCQQELPEIATWYPENADRFPSSDFVTVTTSMDPERGNPLDDYLATEQFPFPVVIDENSNIAAQFGVSAFPFWVVTGGDGKVLYRTAGLIGTEAVEQLFTQLEQVGT